MTTFYTIRREGNKILDDVFSSVLQSHEKSLWKKAMHAMSQHIQKLEIDARYTSYHDPEEADHLIRQLWYWQSARKQLCSRFGKRFIRNTQA